MKLQTIITPEMERDLRGRGNISEVVRESLSRYLTMLSMTRRELQEIFSTNEVMALCDVHNGTLWEPHTLEVVRWSYEDCEDAYDAKWGIDRAALLEKLGKLNLLQCAALVDCIERFWQASSTGMEVKPESILK